MSQEVFIRGCVSVIFSLAFAWVVFSRYDTETGSESTQSDHQKYLPYVPGIVLPAFLVTLIALYAISYGRKITAHLALSMCFGIFLHISAYYIVLILVLPLLRKYISARACAMLWIIPNYLYITQQSIMELPKPGLVITAPGNLVWILFVIWLVGFITVMIWKTAAHILFRKRVLTDAVPVTDPKILAIWNQTIETAQFKKPKFKLVTSPNVHTPLTIGLFRRSVRVILPVRSYSREELELILHHEIIHIGREDAWSKYFLVFCTAMCWFNPLMWLAMRKSAEDLELSCDETVLLGADDSTRRKYADLLLNTAGDERGFTTCLSASASAMRYRLKNITKPAKRWNGALVVGAVFFVLCMTSGYVALAYEDYSGQELIYQTDSDYIDPSYEISGINTSLFEHNGFVKCADEDALERYLAGLRFGRLSGNYSMREYKNHLLLIYNGPNGSFALNLRDSALSIVPLGRSSIGEQHYYALSEIDWEYISSLLYSRYIQDADTRFPPVIQMIGSGYYECPGKVKSYVVNGIPQAEEDWWLDDSEFGLIDPTEESVRITFSHAVAGDYIVEVTDFSGNLLHSYSASDLANREVLPLEDENSRYTIYAPFEDDISSIEMEYTFTVEYSNSQE